MKKLSQLAFILTMIMSLSLFTGVNTINAQVGDTDNDNGSCVDLQYNMRYRMRDVSVNNEVSDLQDYLIAEGYLSGNTTGFFGVATLKAVKSFQAQNGLISSGYVGPVTRAKIKALSCDTAYTNPNPTNPSSPLNPAMPNKPIACTMEYRMCPDGSAMYRDSNCGWHAEMCRGESSNKRLPNITNVTIDNDTMTIYGNNLDLTRNINLAGSANPNIDIRSSFNSPTITSNYIKLENIRSKLEKYIVYTENGYNMTITINNDTQGTTSNTFQFYVPAMKNTLKAASAILSNITGFTNDNGNLYKTYSPGETIKFSIQGYDNNGQVATPAKGFNVQWHMYDNPNNPNTKATTMINGVYQGDNAVFNYNTNAWDITAIAPASNLSSEAIRKLEASFYCSNSSLGCSENQIEKSFMFSVNLPRVTLSFKCYSDNAYYPNIKEYKSKCPILNIDTYKVYPGLARFTKSQGVLDANIRMAIKNNGGVLIENSDSMSSLVYFSIPWTKDSVINLFHNLGATNYFDQISPEIYQQNIIN